ncbi:MAG TPA: GDSL-type esterase/lipase family protein [Candidatus Limnocylindrales bacterium]|nr:GDSL-type esterase/lipase family protein [Candidatus Limnocylindrales bacterium]
MRVRLFALLSGLALWVIAAAPASAEGQDHTYLALGDSVAFGTNPLLDPRNANNFIGYPAIAGKALDMNVVNSACPGEATGSFISLTGLDNVCRPYRAAFPLHTSYTGTQLAFAVDFLKHHRTTRLVTLGLDANDFFRLTSGPGSPWPPSTCFTPDLTQYFATCAVQNLTTIFAAIRGAHYHGLIVVVLYYALNYGDPQSVFVTHDLLNQAMITAGTPFGVRFASGFKAFKAAAAPFNGDSCKAGLLIVLSTSPLSCDVHPTPKGRDLLAKAVVRAVEGDED